MSDQFDTMYYVPSYRAWFFRQDLLPAYEYHRRFLQHLQFRHSARRWVLKAPTHMSALPTLLSVYPDALFMQTHRAPLEAMASVSSLITILRRVFSDSVDPFVVCSDATQYWSETLERILPERDRLPPERICDVDYFEIRRDPIAVARRIYQHFGWLLSRKGRAPNARRACKPATRNNMAVIDMICRSLASKSARTRKHLRPIANGSGLSAQTIGSAKRTCRGALLDVAALGGFPDLPSSHPRPYITMPPSTQRTWPVM